MTTVLASDNGLPGLDRVPIWFNDPSNWWGPDGLFVRIREHLILSAVMIVIAILIALPVGLIIGHTGRGVVVVAGMANALRAVPTLGFVLLLTCGSAQDPRPRPRSACLVPRGGLGVVRAGGDRAGHPRDPTDPHQHLRRGAGGRPGRA